MNRFNLQKTMFAYIGVAVVCLTLSSAAFAVTPPPDGGYAGANTAEGGNALLSLTSGQFNTAIGFNALRLDTTGGLNTALGVNALFNTTIGVNNTAVGVNALVHNISGTRNTAVGQGALGTSTTAGSNTAVGFQALSRNTATENTAFGAGALFRNTTGSDNNAVGLNALSSNTTGGANNAVGAFALTSNVDGDFNNAHGRNCLFNSTGEENNAMGDDAMDSNTTGSMNTAMGDDALDECVDGDSNVAIGDEAGTAIVHGSNIIAIGAGVTGGGSPFEDFDDTCFIGSIFDEPVSDPGSQEAVFVDQFNVVGVMSSSRRFKHDIQPMDKASEAILALKPVTFKYNSDRKGTPQYGLVAEEVAEVNPDLVVRKNGEISTVRYEQINAMLLNEFLKEHKKVQSLETTVALQQKGMEVLTAQLKEQATQIQKVSTQIELNKRAPQTVANK